MSPLPPPVRLSTPEPPISLSLPAPPISVSLPPPPDSVAAGVACDQAVVAAAANGLLDDRVERDPDIVDEAADRGKRARVQIDGLRRRIAGAIERVVAAAVVDRQRRRRGVVGEIEHRAGIAVEAVDGVAGSRRGRRAVHRNDGVDVRHLRRDHVAVRTPGIIRLREIRHDGILPGVVGIDRVGRIRRAAIVRPLVAEAERVSDLVDVGLVAVAVDAGLAVIRAAVGGDPVGADVDGLIGDRAAPGPGAAGVGLHRAVVGERDVRGAGGLHEGDVGDLGPRLHRRLREELLRRIQSGDVVTDGIGSPVMGGSAVVLPKAVDEIVGKRRDRRDRLGG